MTIIIIWQMNIKTTFLNRNLKEEVYMTQPEKFISSGSKSNMQDKKIHLWIEAGIEELKHPL